MNKYEIEFFTRFNGECPVEQFLDSLDEKLSSKMLRLIMLLEENGNELREPYSKYIGDGIFELRVNHSSNAVRVLYFFVVGRKIVITNGFIKKTNKTPKCEIKIAKKYRNEYMGKEL